MPQGVPVGVDLGTTNSAVARVDQYGVPELLPSDTGGPLTPSVVHFATDGDIEVGETARDASVFEPDRVARFFKQQMGNPHYQLEFDGEIETAETLSAHVLGHLREAAEQAAGPLGDAVVTVPAYFRNAQREATIRAAKRAGLAITRTINEPTAAAVAYGALHPELRGTVMVYDLGGGTFDVTILEYGADRNQVVASDGNHDLGGGLWDDRLVNYVCDVFAEQEGEDPRDAPITIGDLRLRCEDAKRALSSRNEVKVAVTHAGQSRSIQVERTLFDELTADLLDQTRVLIVDALRAAGLKWPDVDAVLLVGGSTRMPQVARMLQMLARKSPLRDVNPDECVAAGAAIEAASTSDARFLISAGYRSTADVTPHSLGYIAVSTDGSRFINDIIIPRNAPAPVRLQQTAEVTTSATRENSIDIYLLQGESERVLDNAVLGRYAVDNIPHNRGGTQVNIGFAYDVSGMVQVDCVEARKGTPLPVRVVEQDVDLGWTDMAPDEYFKRAAAAVCLLMDTSGSMSGDPVAEAKRAARKFIDQCPEDMRIGLIEFGRSPGAILSELTSNHSELKKAVDGLDTGNGTPLTAGLASARKQLGSLKEQPVLVVLTDGMPNDPSAALELADMMKASGTRIIAVGAGSSVNHEFIRRLASDADDGMTIDFSELTSTFGRIARAVGQGTGKGLLRLGR